MDAAPQPTRKVTKPRGPGGREAARWDDPSVVLGDDSSGSEDAGGGGPDFDLEGFLAARERRGSAVKETKDDAADGIWDPLEGLLPRKRRKVGTGGGTSAAPGTGCTDDLMGKTVCLTDLKNAPQLNGLVGYVAGPLDGATGRHPVILEDGTVKSLRRENLKVSLSHAIVRLVGLQGAPELNGKVAECGKLDLKTGRYSVILVSGDEKKVREVNLEFVKRYVSPLVMMSQQRRPFTWIDAIEKGRKQDEHGNPRTWAARLKLFEDVGLPMPRLVPADAFAAPLKLEQLASKSFPATLAPTDEKGEVACRIFAISVERDQCNPSVSPLSGEPLQRLGRFAQALEKKEPKAPLFLIPGFCVKPLACARASASCAWPLYLQLCQALICIETEHQPHKAWCRAEELLSGTKFLQPVYLLSRDSKGPGAVDGWLLSDTPEQVTVAKVMSGNILPAERQLLEKMMSELLPGKEDAGTLTCYRL